LRDLPPEFLDRFEQTIAGCLVLDLDEAMPADSFFARAAEALAGRVGLAPPRVLALLRERERQISTALTPDLAITPIVVAGQHGYEVLLARCRKGVRFSAATPAVRAAIVLARAPDEARFHLLALAAIARVLIDPDFIARWLAARGEQGLRDVFLPGKRRKM
jgi:mannitol/fructose-specific phosphotransferase system IIA component (Ntr-type)